MPKRILQGVVIKNTNNKTIAVEVKRRFSHPVYKKMIVTSKKYHAHDEENKCKLGDIVVISESRPISKLKRWLVLEIKESRRTDYDSDAINS